MNKEEVRKEIKEKLNSFKLMLVFSVLTIIAVAFWILNFAMSDSSPYISTIVGSLLTIAIMIFSFASCPALTAAYSTTPLRAFSS